MFPRKAPLYRKVNTTAHGVHHARGGNYRDQRNSKARGCSELPREGGPGRRGRALYHPSFFNCLLAPGGRLWLAVLGAGGRRLPPPDPIFWLVALHEHQRRPYVLIGESSYFSGMYVDADGLLQLVDPSMGPSSLVPLCRCCTHTFNGLPFTRPFTGLRATVEPGENGAA